MFLMVIVALTAKIVVAYMYIIKSNYRAKRKEKRMRKRDGWSLSANVSSGQFFFQIGKH
jgi:hypothetical protein